MAKNVMVIAPAREASPLVAALRRRALHTWSDRIGRVAPDFVSFDWADGLVVVDLTPHMEATYLRPIMEFPRAKVLITPARLDGEQRADLIDRGFDAVVPWPTSTPMIAAMMSRYLSRSAVPVDQRLHA